MKNSTLKLTNSLVSTVCALVLFGCANNNNNDNSVQVRASGAAPSTLSATTGQLVYNSSTSSQSTAVQSLLAESVPSGTTIGTSNNVVFGGQVHFDNSVGTQNLVSSDSYVQLQITTSGQSKPFLISVGDNSSGMGTLVYTATNATANMLFQDQYGWIQVYGQFTAGSPSLFAGQVYYGSGQYNGNSATGIYLGSFSNIPTCSFFACQ